MPAPALLFDPAAAIAGLKSWAEFVLAAHFEPNTIRRGRRNAPANSQRQVTIIPLTTAPVDEAWTDIVTKGARRNRVRVTVVEAEVGGYTTTLLGETAAPFVAGALDTVMTIRDGMRAEVDALALAVTTSIPVVNGVPSPDAFEVLGDAAGVWLGLSAAGPSSGAVAVFVVDDVTRIVNQMRSDWTLRIIVDDVRPNAAGSSSVTTCIALIQRFLNAGQIPIVNGDATIYTDDYLSGVGLSFLNFEVRSPVLDYTSGVGGSGAAPGTIYHERAFVDVVFQVHTGIAYDQPTIESYGRVPGSIDDP